VITSLDNPRVRAVVRLRKARERRREGVLVAEGVREVERALQAGLAVRQIFHAPELLPGWAPGGGPASAGPGGPKADLGETTARAHDAQTRSHEPSARARKTNVRVEEVSARVLAKMSYRDEPEGVIAVFETPTR